MPANVGSSDPGDGTDELVADLKASVDLLSSPPELLRVVELPIREAYDAWAERYDEQDNPVTHAQEDVVQKFLTHTRPATVLDVGCGTGQVAIKAALSGARVVGVDLSPGMLNIAKRRALEVGVDIQFAEGDFFSGDFFSEEKFELVACCLVLCHQKDLDQSMMRLVDRVQIGGHVVVTDFHPFHMRIGMQTSFEKEGKKYCVATCLHSFSDYFAAIERAGLRIVQVVESSVLTSELGFPPVLAFLAKRNSSAAS